MRTRTILAALAVALAPGGALASERILVSGKLDASNGYDFSCSIVNKSEAEINVTLELKNPDGTTYIDPSTFQPVTLEDTLGTQEAAMLVAAAAFSGTTSLYCWAEVPSDARAIVGGLLVRDAGDRATAATPLNEDVAATARELDEQLQDIHAKVENLEPLPGAATGHARDLLVCNVDPTKPPGVVLSVENACPTGKVATGGGCVALSGSGGEEFFSPFVNAPVVNPCDPKPVGWRCAWRNLSATTETVTLCTEVVCVEDGGESVLP